MFGKHFASMYTGSMFGKPAIVFAVWGYVIANMRPSRKDGACHIEINPALLAATFSSTPEEIISALRALCSEDTSSRSPDAFGRRLIPPEGELHSGPMQFVVVNGTKYRELRDEEERRLYLREAKRKERSSSTKLLNVNHGQPRSTQVEVEVEADTQKQKTKDLPAPASASADSEFEELWNANLKKRSKGQARKSYMRLRKAGTLPPHAELLAKFIARQSAQDWTKDGRQFQPHLSSWLNAEGWNDEIDPNAVQDRRAFGSTPDRAAAYGAIGKRVTAKDLAK